MPEKSIRRMLSGSRFRSSFKLDSKDLVYIEKVGLNKIEQHARDFLDKRLASARPDNDGKQTPFRGHPVFKAQHATATCCRGCLSKWYHIPKGRPLDNGERERMITVIMAWIKENI